MHALAQVWEDGASALPREQGGTAHRRTTDQPEVVKPKVNLIEAGADGATRQVEVTPEMMASMHAAQADAKH